CAKRKNVGVNGHKSEIRNPKSEPSSEIFHPNLALDFADFGLVLGMISSLNLTLPPGLNFRSLGFFQCNGTSDEEPGDKPNCGNKTNAENEPRESETEHTPGHQFRPKIVCQG